MTRRLTVLMPFHTPFYAPLSAGVALGHFVSERLEVTAVPAAAFGKHTIRALLDGDIEISLGGLMRSFELAERTGRVIVHFAEVCSRNGFFLLSREPRPGFRWPDLAGKTVISFAEAPTPWQCMLTVLGQHGVEQPQPTAEELMAEGAAHLVASMGEATGPVPFTSYMTTPEFLRTDAEVVLRFTRAVYRTQRWLATHAARDIAEVIAPAFPEIDPVIRERAVARYIDQDTWARDPLLRRPGYEHLHAILLHGGFIKRRHLYEDLVDTEHARQAMAEIGP